MIKNLSILELTGLGKYGSGVHGSGRKIIFITVETKPIVTATTENQVSSGQ